MRARREPTRGVTRRTLTRSEGSADAALCDEPLPVAEYLLTQLRPACRAGPRRSRPPAEAAHRAIRGMWWQPVRARPTGSARSRLASPDRDANTGAAAGRGQEHAVDGAVELGVRIRPRDLPSYRRWDVAQVSRMNHASAVVPHRGYGDCHPRLRRFGDIPLAAQPDVCPIPPASAHSSGWRSARGTDVATNLSNPPRGRWPKTILCGAARAATEWESNFGVGADATPAAGRPRHCAIPIQGFYDPPVLSTTHPLQTFPIDLTESVLRVAGRRNGQRPGASRRRAEPNVQP